MKLWLLAVLAIFVAATTRAESLADQLVGHWQYSEKGYVSDYVIKGDRTFIGHLLQDGKALWHCAGKWTLSGKSITTVLTHSSVEKVLPVGTKDRKVVVEVAKDYCRLQNQDGSIWRYVRVP